MPISQYSKVVPLQLKDDQSSEILLGSLKKKVEKDDIAQAKIQAYADAVGSVDILKETDKQYFDQKYTEAIDTINSQKSYDFSNPNNLRVMSSTIDSLLNDEKISSDIASTKNFREVSKEIEIAINNPKLKHIYNEDTIAYDRYMQEQYVNDTNSNSRFNQKHMTIYDGYKENTQKALKDVAATTKDIQMGGGLMMQTKGKNAFAVQAAIEENIGTSKMPMIEFSNLMRRDPNAVSKIYGTVRSEIAAKTDKLKKAEGSLVGAATDSEYYKQQTAYIENLKAQIDGFTNVLEKPENQEDAYRIFLHNKKEHYLKPALVVDEIVKLDPVYKFRSDEQYRNTMANYKMAQDARSYNLEVAKFEQGKYMDAHEVEIDRARLDIENRKLYLDGDERKALGEFDDVTGMSSVGGSGIGGGTNPYIIDLPITEVVKGQKNPALKFSEDLTRYNTENAAALSRINNLITEPETRAMINNTLKSKGFAKGLDSFNVGAISPANIYKMKAVLDDIFTEGVAKNYITDAISNELRVISENNAKTLFRGSINKQIFNEVFKTMGIKADTKLTSLSPDKQKEVFKKSEALLDSYGLSTIEGKKAIRTNFDKEKGKEVLTNQLKAALIANAGNITDLKGNKVNVKFDIANSDINYVDADGNAYLSLKSVIKGEDKVGELIGKENTYKVKLDNNTFQILKDATIGRNNKFGSTHNLDDLLRVSKIDVAASTGLGNISMFANSLDGLPPKMIVPFRITSSTPQGLYIKLPYTGGDRQFTKNTLPTGNYTMTVFKSTEEFKKTLAQRCVAALQELNKTEAAKNYTKEQKTRIAKDMAVASIVAEGQKSK